MMAVKGFRRARLECRVGCWRASLVVASMLAAAAPVAAQIPGGEQIPRGQIQAEYVADVLTHINAVLAEWGDHWANDRLEELVDLYWPEALLIPLDGSMHRGHAELTAHLAEALPTQGRIEAFMIDFDASGGMSQVVGNYQLEVDGVQTHGVMITVYQRRGRDWRIRSQIFLPPS